MGDTLRQGEAESTCCPALTGEALERAVPLATLQAVLQPTRRPAPPRAHTSYGRDRMGDQGAQSGRSSVERTRDAPARSRSARHRPAPNARGPQPVPARIGARHGGHGHGRPGAADGVAPAAPHAGRLALWSASDGHGGPGAALPDTPANVAVFGRHHRDRGQAALPHLQSVSRAACGPSPWSRRLWALSPLRALGAGGGTVRHERQGGLGLSAVGFLRVVMYAHIVTLMYVPVALAA